MVCLTEHKVPREVSHQANVAGHTVFQSEAQLTESPEMSVFNQVCRQELMLVAHETLSLVARGTHYSLNESLFIVILVERAATVNETNAAKAVGGKAPKRIASCQCKKATTGKLRFGSQANSFNAGAEVFAEEIFCVNAAAPCVIPREELVLTDLTEVHALIRVLALLFAEESSEDIEGGWIGVRRKWVGGRRIRKVTELAGVGSERKRAPDTEVPFMSAIEVAHRRCRLHHFFLAGIRFRAVGKNCRRCCE